MVRILDAEIIRERIENAKSKAGRSDKIFFAAVSKTRTVDEMKEAEKIPWIDFFGENRVQEAESKRKIYGESRVPWRLIGHLQGNKARKAVEIFDTIDSLDSQDLAVRLERIAGELGRIVPVLIEVNTSGEASKSGVEPSEFPRLLDFVANLKNLRLEGLMTVGPITDSEREIRAAFSELRELLLRARERSGLSLPVLSMGMSGDFEQAILEGSTLVRIGTLLFGPRNYALPQSQR
ncbi:MAG: YggS family pyridoxal phosphate-dependent enzyme [Synergistaceae bacterium]|nr:YggS family pyridoxal phosphate-dependent enzyme [Synergistaceae bacterium]